MDGPTLNGVDDHLNGCRGSSTLPRAPIAAGRQSDDDRDHSEGSLVTTEPPKAENGKISSHLKLQSKPINMDVTASSRRVRSHLLASKSNYQCIVDGNHSQLGLSYPDHLLTSVISKRKSHSTAERSRRDRLKNALQRMSELLPKDSYASCADDKIPIGLSVGEAGNSIGARTRNVPSQTTCKASIVETAIDYIQSLQKEVLELKSKLERRHGPRYQSGSYNSPPELD